jgi:hypothetical protein
MERTATASRVGENLPKTRGRKVKARIATREAFASTAKFHSGWSLSLASSFALLMAIFYAMSHVCDGK